MRAMYERVVRLGARASAGLGGRAREATERERHARLLHAIDRVLAAQEDPDAAACAAVELLRREAGIELTPSELASAAARPSGSAEPMPHSAVVQAAAAV